MLFTASRPSNQTHRFFAIYVSSSKIARGNLRVSGKRANVVNVSPVIAANAPALKHELRADGFSKGEVTAVLEELSREERRLPRSYLVP